jgi:hypothetical protein
MLQLLHLQQLLLLLLRRNRGVTAAPSSPQAYMRQLLQLLPPTRLPAAGLLLLLLLRLLLVLLLLLLQRLPPLRLVPGLLSPASRLCSMDQHPTAVKVSTSHQPGPLEWRLDPAAMRLRCLVVLPPAQRSRLWSRHG